MLYSVVKILVLPPACFFVLLLIGWLLKLRWPRVGKGFLWTLLVVAYLATTPYIAGELMAPLQNYRLVNPEDPDPEVGAIVILGAGIYYNSIEFWRLSRSRYSPDAASDLTLERLQYGAFLSRTTGIPIMVSGGPLLDLSEDRSVGYIMRQTLERDFRVRVRWLEDKSTDTWTNAAFSAAQLSSEGIDKIYLVTHAWHMRRALLAFEQTGLTVIPAPTRFFSRAEPVWGDFLPSIDALRGTYYAMHEWIGILWYHLRAA